MRWVDAFGICFLGPKDYDFAVSALPDETKQALNGVPVFDTGLRHGTLTAVVDGHAAECTIPTGLKAVILIFEGRIR